MKVKSLSHVRLFVTPWTAAHQAPPSMRISRQENWSGVPLPSLPTCCCCRRRYCQLASVVSDSVRPHRRQRTRLPRPWDSPGKNTGVGCHFLLQCMKVKSGSDCSPPGSSVHRIFQARVLDMLLGVVKKK